MARLLELGAQAAVADLNVAVAQRVQRVQRVHVSIRP